LDAKTLKQLREFPTSVYDSGSVALTKNDNFIILAGGISSAETDGAGSGIIVLDVKNGDVIYRKISQAHWIRPRYREMADGRLLVFFPDSVEDGQLLWYFAIVDLNTKRYTEPPIDPEWSYSGNIKLADISPDGSIFATQSGESITLWELTDQLIQDSVLENVKDVRFSPDGGHFLAFLPNGKVQFRENATRNVVCETGAFLEDKTPTSVNVSFTPDGQKAVLFSQTQREIKILQLPGCKIQSSMVFPYFGRRLSFNADSSLLALAGGAVPQVYDLQSKEILIQPAPIIPYQHIYDLSFHPSKRDLLAVGGGGSSTGDSGFVYLWNIASQTRIDYQELPETVWTISFSKNNLVVTNEFFSRTILWKAEQGLFRVSELEKGEQILSPDGRYAAISKQNIELLDLSTRKSLEILVGNSPTFSKDGKFLAYAAGDKIRIWDITKRQISSELSVPDFFDQNLYNVKLAFHPDGQILAICGRNPAITFVDVTQQKVLKTLEIPEIQDFSFSPDGQWFAMLYRDGTFSLWGIP
jgi:WD40 repeat protein